MIQYWEGCGESCCRCHCDCDEVLAWRAEEDARIAAITPEQWEAAIQEARERWPFLRELMELEEAGE